MHPKYDFELMSQLSILVHQGIVSVFYAAHGNNIAKFHVFFYKFTGFGRIVYIVTHPSYWRGLT